MSKYIEKYPWLRLRSLYTGVIYDDYDALDEMPEGWRVAFGDLLCEELDAAIKDAGLVDEFVIEQLKEKYGRLVIYVSHETPEIRDILEKYRALSGNVCMYCGKPDVHMLRTGWISPQCEDCFSDMNCSEIGKYSDLAYAGDGKMSNSVTVKIYGKDGREEYHKINCKDTADKIRARWLERETGRS